MKMKKDVRVWSAALVLALVLSLGNGAALEARPVKPGAAEPGPSVNVSEEEMDKDVQEDEEGLNRLGNFGKLHFFGYGELHYNARRGTGANEIDFHRMVLGVGYDFTDWLQFRSEVDFEHAFKEPELEFAHLDFLARPWLNARVGSILVPMGVINQHHEPPLFYSVERPELYRVIIPTSWQEGGAGFFGKLPGGFDYQLYGMSMPRALEVSGGAVANSFNGSNGIRGGRGHVGSQLARDFGVAGRLQYKGLPGLRVGSSLLMGNTGQGNTAIDGGLLTMVEGDAKYSFAGFDLEGVVAFTNLTDAGNINNAILAVNPAFTNFVASQMLGWYLEGAYHVFHHLLPDTKQDLVVFGRFEDFNTQYKMPAGFAGSGANDRNTVTAGLSYLPIPQVALKADYMFHWNKANAGADQFNLGVGFYY